MAGASTSASPIVPNRSSRVSHASKAPGTQAARCPVPGTRSRPRSANRSGVAAAGAGPWPATTTRSLEPATRTSIGTSPPGPLRCGSTTWRVNPVAAAASKALPPRSRIAMPTAEASQWVEATIPKFPVSSGRVCVTDPSLRARTRHCTARRSGAVPDTHGMKLADIPVPSTPAATTAREVVKHFSPPALVNHCVRAYLLAVALGATEGLEVDHELLYVASMLHDLTLEPAFDNHSLPFEDAGAHLAWVFAAGAGWPERRRERAGEIIIAHMRGTDPAVDPEGHLLDLSTGLDIGGRAVDRWPEALLAEAVAAHPRLDPAPRFTPFFRAPAARN